MADPRRHHYVPEFYLKGFCPPDKRSKIFVYDKNKGTCIHTNVKNVAVKKDYYKLPDSDDPNITPFMLEEALSEIEGEASSLLPEIIRGNPLNDEQRYLWATFIAVMYCRGPNARQMVADLQGAMLDLTAEALVSSQEAFEGIAKKYGNKNLPKISYEDAKDFIHKKRYSISIREDATLLSFSLMDKVAPIIFEMNWKILKVIDISSLVTTDTPVIYENPINLVHPIYGDGGLLNKNVQICFPLNRKHMFVATWKDYSNIPSFIMSNGVERLNNAFIAQAFEYVYADKNDVSILEIAKQSRGHHRRLEGVQGVEVKIERNFD